MIYFSSITCTHKSNLATLFLIQKHSILVKNYSHCTINLTSFRTKLYKNTHLKINEFIHIGPLHRALV